MEAELDALGEELELEEQEELDKHLLDVGPAFPSQLPEVSMTAARAQRLQKQLPEVSIRLSEVTRTAACVWDDSCLSLLEQRPVLTITAASGERETAARAY